MKTLLSLLLFLVSLSFCSSQSSIGLSIGYGFNQTIDDNPFWDVYNLNRWLIGVPVGFKWNERWETLASVNLTSQKLLIGHYVGIEPPKESFHEQMSFARISAEQHFYPIKQISIGIGGFYAYKFYEQFKNIDGDWEKSKRDFFNKHTLGINSSLSLKIRQVSFDLRYFVGLSPILDVDIPGAFIPETPENVKGFNRSLELTANYHFPFK